MTGAMNVQYAEGKLLFLRGNTLVAQAFDVQQHVLTSEVLPVVEGVLVDSYSRTGLFSVSSTGALVYRSSAQPPPSQLTWFDRSGRQAGVLGDPSDYNTVNLSPDDTRAAVSVREESGDSHIWLVDVARGVRTRLTFDPSEETQGVWSPDGTRVIFDSLRGRRLLYQKSANGGNSEEAVDTSPVGKFPTSWSADSRFFLFNSPGGESKTGNDLWVVPLAGDRKPFVYLQTPFNEARGQFSPDSRWIAFQSNESGRFEIYVGSFPGPGRLWRVSSAGGTSARWRRDGKELFYVSADSKLMAVPVDGRGASLVVGTAQPLFNVRIRDQFLGIPYAVTSDGQRFLVNTLIESGAPASISLVLNWPSLLRH